MIDLGTMFVFPKRIQPKISVSQITRVTGTENTGVTKKLNLPCPIPTGSSPLDRVIYISKDAHLNVEYDVNCFQSEFVTKKM